MNTISKTPASLVATDVWAAAARTLTDFSAEELFDLPELDSTYGNGIPSSGGVGGDFGAWVELVADVGVGKRLIAVPVRQDTATGPANIEVEIGEGANPNEAAITRFSCAFRSTMGENAVVYVWRSLTDNARLSVRIRDSDAAARTYVVGTMIA